jgi:phage terminase large subunit-like protein
MSKQLDALTKSLVTFYADKLNASQQEEMIQALGVLADDQKYNKFKNFFPTEGVYRRELYKKHIDFFRAGAKYKQRGFIAANRVGKSEAGAFETTCHATGDYPDWWEGKRFHQPTLIWAGGDTAVTCRDILQKKLLGEIGDLGSGMIPKDLIVETKTKRNVADAIETIRVKHVTGGVSTIVLKSYEQGRSSWHGPEVDFIWIDEECPQDVYGEALIRTMTTKGCVILTFTPLSGLTDLVIDFLENSQETDTKYPKYITNVTWDDVPHLSVDEKEEMLAGTPPNLRDARSKGEPTHGAGRIYPLTTEEVVCDPIQIPKYWRKAFALDVGWNNTASVWGAWDESNDIIYIYSEYKQGEQQPIVHSQAIKSRGDWIKGCIDPASRGRAQADGEKLFEMYTNSENRGGCGLNLIPATNAVDAGIYEVWERLSTGRLKFFKTCTMLLREFNLYYRDDKGRIVKKNDHLLDALRYLMMTNKSIWTFQPSPLEKNKVIDMSQYMKACV